MKKKAFLFLVSLLCLGSCTKELHDGIVIEKRYTPALTYGPYGPPYDEYMLKLELTPNSKKRKVYVTKQIFEGIDVGDMYTIIQ